MGCGGSAASHYATRPDDFGPVSTAGSQSSGEVAMHPLVSKRLHLEIGEGTRFAEGEGELRSLSFEDFEEPDAFGVDATSAVLSLRKGGTVFVKRLLKGRDRWGELTEACQREMHMLKTLSGCPGVIALHGTVNLPSELWTVFEFCDGGDLQTWLSRFPSTARSVARQLLEAVKHLHAKRVCHRNLRPSNVLLTNSGRLRLSGFTHACALVEDEQQKDICGSDGFRAPEVTKDGYCGLAADIYSLGRTLETLARIEMRWKELARVCLDMTSPNPTHRPDIEVVYAALFGGGQWSMTMTPGVPFLQLPSQLPGGNCVTPKWGSSPEPSRKQAKSEQSQSPNDERKEAMSQLTIPRTKAARRQFRKGHRWTISCESKNRPGGEGKSRADEPTSDELHLACSSAFCIRMGTCFCHDKLPAVRKTCDDSQCAPRAKGSPRLTASSEHDRRTPVARSVHGSLELLE
eukprot:TRINITY_DN25267_c0_g1_i2.p1 TRINITY_DN25267_c0_g1~~TRINITY_DN25267_c0_g1_i2.p1  ORF type:complete len:461 (-),score=69.90 TRINITY_DN25267_c0_g1_i2:39-1421(-)